MTMSIATVSRQVPPGVLRRRCRPGLRAADPRAAPGDDPRAPARGRRDGVRPERLPRLVPRRGRGRGRVHEGRRLLELQEQGGPVPRGARRPDPDPGRGVHERPRRFRPARRGDPAPDPRHRRLDLGRRGQRPLPGVRRLRGAQSGGPREARGAAGAPARVDRGRDPQGVRAPRQSPPSTRSTCSPRSRARSSRASASPA